MSDAQSRWEDQRANDCANHGQAKCQRFPDCACEECHSFHVEEHEFNEFCEICKDQKCEKCKGEGWYKYPESDDHECEVCDGSGRIKV